MSAERTKQLAELRAAGHYPGNAASYWTDERLAQEYRAYCGTVEQQVEHEMAPTVGAARELLALYAIISQMEAETCAKSTQNAFDASN